VVPYKCSELHDITDDIAAFSLEPINHIQCFIPGQYVELKSPFMEAMPFSIANTPRKDGKLYFHLRHDKHHPNVDYLLNYIMQSKIIDVSPPKGKCTLQNIPIKHKELILLAGGTGIVPFLSIVEHALLSNYTKKIKLIWGIKHPKDAYAVEILNNWQEQYKNFQFEILLSSQNQINWHGLRGLIPSYLPIHSPNLKNSTIIACGPYQMVKKCQDTAIKYGLPKNSFYSDMITS
jgi:CDP-4-dehydro-6-deoxyglucose reductase